MGEPDVAAVELIDLESIRKFLVVAEELNFTRAAARLGMAQPPLSAAIGKLERKLGVTLLERTRRQGTQPGRLTVAVKPGTGTELLQRTVRRYAHDPGLPQVQLMFGSPGGPAAAVRSGAADVAILRGPFDQRGLDTELLLTEPRVAALPAGHRLAGRAELCRADLSGEPMPHWAGAPDPAAAAYWTGGGPDAGGPPGPEINDISQLLDAVALGGAVAYVPASLTGPHRGAAGLVFVPVRDLSPSELLAVWPAASRSRAVAAFVRAAVEAAVPTAAE
ncbi:MAG TPA: LysR family transcriptional regulator [Trebonia sp.]|nr:LysR family transcriptional regulator [Trebonia sp.]